MTEGPPVVEGTEEILDAGRQRAPSRWRGVLGTRAARGGAAVLVAAAVVGALLTRHTGDRSPTAAPSSAAQTSAAAPVEPHVVQVVRTLAGQRPGLVDYARSSSARGACVLVDVGNSPQLRASQLVEHSFAGFAVVSVARTIDEFGQLCELRLLAHDRHGTTLVLRIVSPPQARADRPPTGPDSIDIGGDSDGTRSIAYVSVSTTQGWSMLVGSIGPVADQPGSSDMLRVGDDAALRW